MAVTAVPAIVLTLCALMWLPTDSDAAGTASIAGMVTAPAGSQIVATICAIASSGKESCTATPATNINGSSPGAYEVADLEGGEYTVRFAARCSVEPCAETFPPEYYDNKTSLAEATHVTLSTGESLTGIDASIEGDAERRVREYLENEGPAQPFGEGTGTVPGAIEPMPADKQAEEEFWANPPWKKQETTAAGAAAPARCVVPALKGDSLAAARNALRKANCTLGRVRQRHHASGTIVVRKQKPRAGRRLAAGAAVTVTLGRASGARRPRGGAARRVG